MALGSSPAPLGAALCNREAAPGLGRSGSAVCVPRNAAGAPRSPLSGKEPIPRAEPGAPHRPSLQACGLRGPLRGAALPWVLTSWGKRVRPVAASASAGSELCLPPWGPGASGLGVPARAGQRSRGRRAQGLRLDAQLWRGLAHLGAPARPPLGTGVPGGAAGREVKGVRQDRAGFIELYGLCPLPRPRRSVDCSGDKSGYKGVYRA